MPDHDKHDTHGSRPGFALGFAAGLVGAIALVALNDMSLRVLPATGSARAAGAPAAAPAARALFVPGALPEGARVAVDGKAVECRPEARGFRVPWPDGAVRITFLNERGVLWTAAYPGLDAPDTLTPTLGGEVAVEVARQAPAGDIVLDGRPAGRAPATITDVPAGWHVVGIVEEGRVLYQDECHVRPGETTRVLVPPAPPWGRGQILVRSRLVGAAGPVPSSGEPVWVDGTPAGAAPIDCPATAGFHSVRVERHGFPPHVEVVYVAAGESGSLTATFGAAERLEVEVAGAGILRAGAPAALPVRISALGAPIRLDRGAVHLVRPGHEETVEIPLVESGTSPLLWAAVLPADLVAGGSELRGFVRCRDEEGREGVSEIFAIPVD